jgi:hypothetical protein
MFKCGYSFESSLMVNVISLKKTWLSNDTVEMFTDSSGNPELDCGAYFCGGWAQFRWRSSWKNLPIL